MSTVLRHFASHQIRLVEKSPMGLPRDILVKFLIHHLPACIHVIQLAWPWAPILR